MVLVSCESALPFDKSMIDLTKEASPFSTGRGVNPYSFSSALYAPYDANAIPPAATPTATGCTRFLMAAVVATASRESLSLRPNSIRCVTTESGFLIGIISQPAYNLRRFEEVMH